MEDTHVHTDNITTQSPWTKIAYYGVYDGHGGKHTAEFVQEELHKTIFETEEFKAGSVLEAIPKAFHSVDHRIIARANAEGWMNGTTAVIALILDGQLHMANVGDAEACLVKLNNDTVEAENLTYPHKASDQSEKKRIEELGGHVFFGRVFGALAVARAFGDSRYKQPKTSQNFVSVEPYLHEVITLEQSHKYLILACDGLWDVCTHQQAAEFVHKGFSEGKSSQQVSVDLVQHALDLKTDDNVTVVVVKLEWDVPAEATPESNTAETPADETH
eukprot:TRINITY_DN13265_c0_g1_i1.p1 TRINITY_DN13265_c0_g1~~TRINITY_DN13265_c0_g1_i1.p1  ORF type:complete len:307 (-),score=66.07 TRINITY_DN13265_c0_g1_i1:69-890(-)